MKAVILIRNEEKDHNAQILRLREYCVNNNIEVVQEITGLIDLTKINFTEETVILGV